MRDISIVKVEGRTLVRLHGGRGSKVFKSARDYNRQNKSWRRDI